MGKRFRRISGCLASIWLILAGCTVPEPNLAPTDVLTRPGVRYEDFRNLVVYVDMTDVPVTQRDPAIVWETEKGLRDRGFDVLSHNDYMEFLKKKAISPSQSGEPRLLAMIRQELDRAAVVRVHVGVLMVQSRRVDPLRTVTPGVPGARGDGGNPTDVALRDRSEWVIDLSLDFEMIDASTAISIWSCSLTTFQSAYEGKVPDFIKKAVAVCLDTIPAG